MFFSPSKKSPGSRTPLSASSRSYDKIRRSGEQISHRKIESTTSTCTEYESNTSDGRRLHVSQPALCYLSALPEPQQNLPQFKRYNVDMPLTIGAALSQNARNPGVAAMTPLRTPPDLSPEQQQWAR
ncbi:hypothetical protein PMIN03_006523 [Paraphaeosphaeria minitans]|uniref:Uncharacterized protein n=1 Tax=Paraphaeosphaeria minitans TaxID=565426 RepID=A0A9P6KPY8_9PLEO|nr:hypothetical protein PMIN01_07149 [Paraphaeosphaeria minitans]